MKPCKEDEQERNPVKMINRMKPCKEDEHK